MNWAPGDLERVRCDLCGRDDGSPLFRRPDGLQVVECPTCRLAYLDPRPNPASVARLYSADYFFKLHSTERVGWQNYLDPANLSSVRYLGAERLRKINEVQPLDDTDVLEVGCAAGEVCALLAEAGARPLGIDLSPEIVAEAKRRHPKLNFVAGDVASLDRARRFDLVLAFEVVEHVPSPRQFILDIHARLKLGGVLAFSTPNLDSGRRLGMSRWLGVNVSFEHLYFLDPDTTEQYALMTGFEVVGMYSGGGAGQFPVPATPSRSKVRTIARRVLGAVGVLEITRSLLRGLAAGPLRYYSVDLSSHNLLVLMRKRDGRPPALVTSPL